MKPTQITLRNPVGTSAVLSTFGARLVKLHVPDKHGTSTNVVLGFSTQKHYKEFQDDLIGATVGRLAGRVAKFLLLKEPDSIISTHRTSRETMERARQQLRLF